MEAQVQQYGYLWDGTAPQWALMNVGASGAKAAKLIENNLDADEVVKRMLAAGVRVLTPAEFQAN